MDHDVLKYHSLMIAMVTVVAVHYQFGKMFAIVTVVIYENTGTVKKLGEPGA